MRAIASNGLPLKIKADWTENDYWDRRHQDTDDLTCVTVKGWLVRINGKKYPRGHFDGDDTQTGPTGTHREKETQKQARRSP